MKGTTWVVLLSIGVIVVVIVLLVISGRKSTTTVEAPMSVERARQYAAAWTKTRSDVSLSSLKTGADGGFFGPLGPLDVEYLVRENVLVVRGTASRMAEDLVKAADIMEELGRIAESQPEEVAGGKFELAILPWDNSKIVPKEHVLYIRIDFPRANLSNSDMIDKLNRLSRVSLEWRQLKLGRVIQDVVARRVKK